MENQVGSSEGSVDRLSQADYDDQFAQLFGARPVRRDFKTLVDFTHAISWWNQQKRWFGGFFDPADVSEEYLAAVENETERYAVGKPYYYFNNGRQYVFFPDVFRLENTIGPNLDFGINSFFAGVQQTIAQIQSRMIRKGHFVANLHPFVPGYLQAMNADLGNKFIASLES